MPDADGRGENKEQPESSAVSATALSAGACDAGARSAVSTGAWVSRVSE